MKKNSASYIIFFFKAGVKFKSTNELSTLPLQFEHWEILFLIYSKILHRIEQNAFFHT